MKIYLETKRLILREITQSDVNGIFELDSNPIVHKYLGNKPITTKEKASEIIDFIQKQYIERGIGRWAAVEKSSGEFIGWSGLKLNIEDEELNNQVNFYDIGYRFIPRYWNKGYASESAKAILDYGFNSMNLSVIVGAAEQENVASNRVLQKIGLQFINEFLYEDIKCNWYNLNKVDYENMS